MATTEHAVELAGLRHVFPGRGRGRRAVRDVEAVKDVDLTIAPGEFVSIVGPSGCGKSTILKIIAGLLRPAEGAVRVWGSRSPARAATSASRCRTRRCCRGGT